MNNLLVPDIPAGQSSNIAQEEMEKEPSCCSPIRSKLKTSPIKVFSLIQILCGVLAIGLGIVACVFGCMYPGAGIVAGVAFVATGVVGMCVVKHGVLAAVYEFLSVFSFLMSIALMVLMLAAREGSHQSTCSSYDCRHDYSDDNCCHKSVLVMPWKIVAVDLAILVVAVVELVASMLATTLSLRNTNWVKICCLKKNMDEQQAVSNSFQRTSADSTDECSPLSGQSPAMKRCWKPCESKGHRNLTITLSVIDIVIGVICVAIGISAVFVETQFAHVGIPIWSGLLIFAVTGISGLLSVTKKGLFIPCFFTLSILAFLMSINMFTWASANISEGYEDDYIYGCIDWSCKTTPTPYNPFYSYYPSYYVENTYCYDCMPGCCQNDYTLKKDKTYKILVDWLTVGFGVLEMLICMVTIGLSFSQLSCYVCFRGLNCNCCQRKTIDQYQMVMTPNGNLMMLAVPRANGVPTMVHNQQNQPVMVQQQPVMNPNQHIAAQNQPIGTFGTGELTRPDEQVHGAQQPVTVQAQGQPMLVQSPGQVMMVGGQGQVQAQRQPMLIQAQGQPMMLPAQGQPMIVQGHGQPMMVHQGQGQPMMLPAQGQPMTVQGDGQPMMVHHGQGQPMMLPAQGQPMTVQGHGQPMMVHQGQGQPMFQQPMFVQGVGQVGMVQSQGQPTNQPVMIPGEGQTLHMVTQAQMPNPEQQIQATGEPADTGEPAALVVGQDAGSILNPTV